MIMKEITCIVCPNSCLLKVEEKDGKYIVTGNRCVRGIAYGTDEMTNPKRTISSTVKTIFSDVPVVPIKASADFPKERIFDVMKEINKIVLDKRVGRGYKVIENCLGLNIDIVITSDILLNG